MARNLPSEEEEAMLSREKRSLFLVPVLSAGTFWGGAGAVAISKAFAAFVIAASIGSLIADGASRKR